MERNELNTYMDIAIEQARIAYSGNEVPVGAIIVLNGSIIAKAHNSMISNGSSIEHAELIAIRDAQHETGDWRLNGAYLFCTVEPCIMCAFAAVLARIDTVVYGTPDSKFGGIESLASITEIKGLNHSINVIKSIRENECSALMTSFFRNIRKTRRGG